MSKLRATFEDNDVQIIMRLPSYIDHPLAGRDVEVLKSIYELKDSNASNRYLL